MCLRPMCMVRATKARLSRLSAIIRQERHLLEASVNDQLESNWQTNMSNVEQRPYVPAKHVPSDYPVSSRFSQ